MLANFAENGGREAGFPSASPSLTRSAFAPYCRVAATETVQQGQIGYDARVADLTGAGWTAVYSVNGDPHNNENVRLYRGQFAPPNTGVLPAP